MSVYYFPRILVKAELHESPGSKETYNYFEMNSNKFLSINILLQIYTFVSNFFLFYKNADCVTNLVLFNPVFTQVSKLTLPLLNLKYGTDT